MPVKQNAISRYCFDRAEAGTDCVIEQADNSSMYCSLVFHEEETIEPQVNVRIWSSSST